MPGMRRRGQPLIALVLLLGSWVSARAMMWDDQPMPRMQRPMQEPDAPPTPYVVMGRDGPMSRPPLARATRMAEQVAEDATTAASAEPYAAAPPEAAEPAPRRPEPRLAVRPEPRKMATPPPAPMPTMPPVPVRTAVSHHLLWMAAMARVPMPGSFTDGAAAPDAPAPALASAAPAPKRWSADGWILWRRGSTGIASGGLLTPSYGASQAGAVVRYRLAPGSALRPAAYLRTTAALNGSSEREAAFGLQLRPIARLPLALAGEARLTAIPGQTFVRPAVFAYTELPPFALPLRLRGEFYGQGGYVGGRNATAFADGQLRVDGKLAALGKGDLRLGGGVWGGAQKGAARLDAGPSLTIGQPLGGSAGLRLAADWRFRVAGKAAPGSGPAVTLSAGF